MDPRPYNYEYRRPRLNNPTYQSLNLYESLYHMGKGSRYTNQLTKSMTPTNSIFNKQYANQTNLYRKNNSNMSLSSSVVLESINNNKSPKEQKNNNQRNNRSNQLLFQRKMVQSLDRPYSNRSNNAQKEEQFKQNPSILSSYGRNSMKAYDYLDRFNIYKKQQKPYNIVGNYPQNNLYQLKKYPRLTLQNKLIEEGRFNPENR